MSDINDCKNCAIIEDKLFGRVRRIAIDSSNFMVQKKIKLKSGEAWQSHKYYSNLGSALRGMLDDVFRSKNKNRIMDLKTYISEYRAITDEFRNTFKEFDN